MPVCHNHELLLQSNSCTSTQSEKLGHEVSHFRTHPPLVSPGQQTG
uniref:Uncharacterized protein n=1 Tax=Anguilla anguilla TaxID=7936 RepID=A0A0E9VCB9_ANGAN